MDQFIASMFYFTFLDYQSLISKISLPGGPLDQHPNYLTPLKKQLCLVDAGYFINTSCPPLLRKERNVDVILSLDYNLSETRFHVRFSRFNFLIGYFTSEQK